MPMPVNGQAALVNGTTPKTTGAALNLFVEAGKQLAKSLLISLRNNPPVAASRQEPARNSANAIQPTHVAEDAVAPVANAPAAHVPHNPAANNAKNWLDAECDKLERALNRRNNNSGDTDTLENRTQSLYAVALEIKQQIEQHRTGLEALLPDDLRADFDQNIQYIQDHFNARNNANDPKTSLAEIEFLNAYFNYMKGCLHESHPELSRKLETVEKKLGLLKQDLLKVTSTKKEELAAAQAKVELERLEEDIAQNPHPKQEQVEERNALSQKARKFNGDLVQANRKIAELRPAIEQLETVQPPHAKSIRQLPIHSVELVKQTQKIEACRLGAGIYRNVETGELASNLAVNKLTKEFKETQALAMVCKRAKPDWVAASVKLKNQLIQLQADPGHAVEIDDALRIPSLRQGPACKITEIGIGQNKNVYQHALLALGLSDNNPQNGEPANPVYTPEEKELALILIGGWAAQQCTIASDNHGDTYARTQLIMDNAAILLGARIVSKTENPDQPASKDLKQSVAKFIQEYIQGEEAKSLESSIQKFPESITNRDYAECFTNAVGLQSCLSLKHKTSDAQLLIKYAKTDRTFEKDRTAGLSLKEGQSRQSVLKESMIRAAALMKPDLNPDTVDAVPDSNISRIKYAKDAASADRDIILARLGLGGEIQPTVLSDELLDQLTMAAVAQNDLSLKDNHLHRGSMENKIQRYENRSTVETLKNHNLNNFDDLNKKLIDTAIMMRQPVNEAIERTKNSLQQNQQVNPEDVKRLIKQIIITTDSKSALNPQFDLKELTEAATALGATNNASNRGRLFDALGNVQLAWRDGEPETPPDAAANRPAAERWNTADSRSTLRKVLTSDPVRSLPFLNRIPLLGKLCSAGFKLGKALVATTGTAVIASLTVPIAAVATSGYGIYKGYKAVNR